MLGITREIIGIMIEIGFIVEIGMTVAKVGIIGIIIGIMGTIIGISRNNRDNDRNASKN